MSKRIGFFKENIQRDTGPNPGREEYVIDPVNLSNVTMRFDITSTNKLEPTLNYEFTGLPVWVPVINESVTGTIALDSDGNASISISLITEPNTYWNEYLGDGDKTFNLNLYGDDNFNLVESVTCTIIDVGGLRADETMIGSGGVVDGWVANGYETLFPDFPTVTRTIEWFDDGWFKIGDDAFGNPDPWTGVQPTIDVRTMMVGGGGAGGTSTGGNRLSGGGGGGFLDETGLDASTLTLDYEFPLIVGAGADPNPVDDKATLMWGGESAVYWDGGHNPAKYIAKGGYNNQEGTYPQPESGLAGNVIIDGVVTVPSTSPGATVGSANGGGASFANDGIDGVSGVYEESADVPGRGAHGSIWGSSTPTQYLGAGGGSTGISTFPAWLPVRTVSSGSGNSSPAGYGQGGSNSSTGSYAYNQAGGGYPTYGNGGGGAGDSVFPHEDALGGEGGSGRVWIVFHEGPFYRAFAIAP